MAKRLTFAQRLAAKFEESGLGEVYSEAEENDDTNESKSIEININGMSVCFILDFKGEKIESIGLYKDVVQVVNQKMIWKSDNPSTQEDNKK